MLPASGWLRFGYLRVKQRKRVTRPLRYLGGHLSWPASSSPMAISPASASPRPPQRFPRNPPARQSPLRRKEWGTKPQGRPRRDDRDAGGGNLREGRRSARRRSSIEAELRRPTGDRGGKPQMRIGCQCELGCQCEMKKPLRGVPPSLGQGPLTRPFWQNEPKIFSIFQSLGNSDFG